MKKAAALMTVTLVASMVFVFTNISDISVQKENILFWEDISVGDSSFVSDLRINTLANYGDSIYWNSKIHPRIPEKSKTKIFFKRPKEKDDDNDDYNARVSSQNYDYRGVYLKMKYKFDEDTDDFGVESNRYEEIVTKDYFEYYPISLYLEFPGAQFSVSSASNYDYYDKYIDGEPGKKYDMLDYFKIPVLENEKYIVDNQYYYDTELPGEPEGDYYHPSTYNVLTDDACLFTFDIHSNNGKVMDTSHMKEGYGIYRLPYKMVEQEDSTLKKPLIAVEDFSMVYPLSTDMEIIRFELNKDKTHLHIVYAENNKFILTIIDVHTLETLKVLTLGSGSAKNHEFLYTEDGQYMALLNYDSNQISLVSTPENEDYRVLFIGDLFPAEIDVATFQEPVIVFDGTTLALAAVLIEENFPTTKFFLSAYTEKGLQYYGQYNCSLSTDLSSGDVSEDYSPMHFYKLSFD